MWQGVCPWPLMLSVSTNTRWVTLLPSGPGFAHLPGSPRRCLSLASRRSLYIRQILYFRAMLGHHNGAGKPRAICRTLGLLEPRKGQVLSLGSSWALPAPDPACSLGMRFYEPARMGSSSGTHPCLLVHEFPCTLLLHLQNHFLVWQEDALLFLMVLFESFLQESFVFPRGHSTWH